MSQLFFDNPSFASRESSFWPYLFSSAIMNQHLPFIDRATITMRPSTELILLPDLNMLEQTENRLARPGCFFLKLVKSTVLFYKTYFHIVVQVDVESPPRCPLTNLNTLSDLYEI